MTTSIGGSIVNILNGGNGIDTTALVNNLVNASRQPRQAAIDSGNTLNNARISAIASATSSLNSFSSGLTTALQSSNYSGQPVSNDPSIVAVSLIPGGVPTGLPAQIEVTQLATAQTLASVSLTNAATNVGLGTLTLTTATGSFPITIDATNDSMTGLASAINAANAGVSASVVIDNTGARLVLKGITGQANAFTLTNSGNADTNLQRFTFDGTTGGMALKQSALDSIVKIDNVVMQNTDNVLTNAIPFVRIDLNKAAPGTLVTLATDQPTSTMKDLVSQFVTAYNTLRTALNGATAPGTTTTAAGALAGDAGVRDMVQKLQRLTTTPLVTSGPYTTLNDLGVSTNRDGTLTLDTKRLDAAISANPSAVTQMLNPAVTSVTNPGLAGAVSAIKDSLEASSGSLTTSKTKYDNLKANLDKQLAKLDQNMTDYETQLNTTYSAMQSQLSVLNATKSYLDQQIAVWNNSKN
ncbi:MAG: flagellar filament capping protein FliD [Sphingobium sp.]